MITRAELEAGDIRTVDGFVTRLLEDDLTECTLGEVQALAGAMGLSMAIMTPMVKAAGVEVVMKRSTARIRGFSSPLNGTPRFSGENSTFTTPGTSSILGFGGNAGW
jgi:hypothetical protein